MDNKQERIRETAYRIWREEGCPHGRDRQHWDQASRLVAMEEGAAGAQGEQEAPHKIEQPQPAPKRRAARRRKKEG